MNEPKTRQGRARQSAYLAHDARRARLRLQRAQQALEALRWDLQRNDEVLRHLYVNRKSDVQWAMEVMRPLEETLARLNRGLDGEPPAAEALVDDR